jgi:hypothetical protein
MKKIAVGLISGSIMLVAGVLISKAFQLLFPSLIVEYENTTLIKPWTDPNKLIVFATPFILGIILAILWDRTKPMFNKNNATIKGINFGLIFWIISIPAMVLFFNSFPFSVTIIVCWVITLLIQALCSGFIFSKMLR